MQQTSPQKLLFVINPISGGREKTEHETAISEHFKSLPHSIHYFLLTGNNDARRVAEEIEKIKPDKVVAVGGDGTVTMVAKQVLGTNMEMAILPAGSANGMARELNIPLTLPEALLIADQGQVKKADVIKINDQVCLHLSDIGLNARLIKYFEEGNMRGKLGYAKVGLKVLWRKQHMQVVIETKGAEIKRDAFMVVLANASKYGTGAVINPEGDLYDGLFEVVIIRRLAVFEILKMWFSPKPFNPKNIEMLRAESVRIETAHRVHFQVDGEYIGKVKKVVANILHAKLNIIVPPETDESKKGIE
jgi:diacylglycerol kinase (ATP)